jgi:hypothetical protein
MAAVAAAVAAAVVVAVEAGVAVAVVAAVVAAGDPVDRVDRVVAAAGAATVPLTAMPHHQRSMIPCAAASPGPPRCLATSGAGRA